jgi:hypothetical protein
VFFIELSGHIFFCFLKGRSLRHYVQDSTALFNVRPYTELVNDDRLVTNKRNYTESKVRIDGNRFRVGTNEYSKEKPSIVFLGDSVPFGWDVTGEQCVPSKFYDLIRNKYAVKYGVINAAVPSYSLYQAIMRYRYEIDGKFPVKYVILQIYDPAAQFAALGREWNQKTCWTSKSRPVLGHVAVGSTQWHRFLYRHSFIYHTVFWSTLQLSTKPLGALDIKDEEAFNYFERENLSLLERFHGLLRKDNIDLIILPVNVADPTKFDKLSPHMAAVNALNKTFYQFASSHKGVYYFDVIAYFDKVGREPMFIDACCHLSELGAQKQSEFILEQLLKNGLL